MIDIDWEKIIVLDWEKNGFLATVDGVNTLEYSKDEVINCKHIDDFPGYTSFVEGTHLNPESKDNRGRGAQLFSDKSLLTYHNNLLMRGVTQMCLPNKRTPRVIFEAGYENDKTKSCLAWFIKIQKDHDKIQSWFKKWHPLTEKEKVKRKLREETRRDSCYLIDRAASKTINYKHPDVEDMRALLLQAYDNRLSEEAKTDLKIVFVYKGKENERLDFNKASCMALYWSYCKEGGELRTDKRGQPLGIKTIEYGLLQSHAHNAGKGSHAACRAKLKHDRLLHEEKNDRIKNGIKTVKKKLAKTDDPDEVEIGGFNAPRPLVRKRHENVNKEILRLIRDSKIKNI